MKQKYLLISIIILIALLYVFGDFFIKAIGGSERLIDLKWFLIAFLFVTAVCFDWLVDIKYKGVSFFLIFVLSFFVIVFIIATILFTADRITSADFAKTMIVASIPILLAKSVSNKDIKLRK